MTTTQARVVALEPTVHREGGEITVRYPVRSEVFPDTLWFRFDSTYADFVKPSMEAVLLALLLPAMRLQADFHVQGPVSTKLWTACLLDLQTVLNAVLGLESVALSHEGPLTADPPRKIVAATGFSGGVDSYAVLRDFHFEKPEGLPGIDYLFFNNVGANGSTIERELFHRRRNHVKIAAGELGIPLMVVDSNMDDFYAPFPDLYFRKSYTLRNAAVAHLMSNGISVYRFAAGQPYRECFIGREERLGHVDPVLLPLLSSEMVDLQFGGGRFTRAEKIERIATYEVVRDHLHVCVDHDAVGNCSTCQKCVRTLLVIDLLGLLDGFGESFDMEKYRGVKKAHLVRHLAGDQAFSRDIQALFARSGERLGPGERLRVTGLKARRGAGRMARGLAGLAGRGRG